MEPLRGVVAPLAYVVSSSLFIVGLKRLSHVRTARSGNAIAAIAMLLATLGTLLELGAVDYRWIAIGVLAGTALGLTIALRVAMTEMPEMVALLNGLGGAASALVAIAIFWAEVVTPGAHGTAASILGAVEAPTSAISVVVGAVTFTGSAVAFLKLRGTLADGRPILLPARHVVNALLLFLALAAGVLFAWVADGPSSLTSWMFTITAASLVLGALLVLPIGGADMPVVVSLLNSYSGVAASAAGFVTGHPALIVAGAMVGAAGLILTNLMCKAMNRSLAAVLVGGFGQTASATGDAGYEGVKSATPQEAALILDAAQSVVFVPGYGLAVAQAQHAVKELADELLERGATVRFAIHPVAGRMPGHMNVLLAEADVPYEQLVELDAINPELKSTDVAIVLGANDVVNPAALDDPTSPIRGMPILLAHEARTVLVVKRSLAPGYAGIKNPLFERDNTLMLFGDVKTVVQDTTRELRSL